MASGGAVPSEVQTALQSLLLALSSNDNTTRSQAEKALESEWLVKQPQYLVIGLADGMLNSRDATLRSYSAVLLRRLAYKTIAPQTIDSQRNEFVWETLPADIQIAIQAVAIQAFANEQEKAVRHRICDVIIEAARSCDERDQSWPELFPALYQSSKSTLAGHRESAYRVLASLPTLTDSKKLDTEVIKQIFSNGLMDGDGEVALAALEAYSSFLVQADISVRSPFHDLLPTAFNVLPPLLSAHHSEALTTGLGVLGELLEVHPKMFKPHFLQVVEFCVAVVKDKELEDAARQQAIEFLLTFAEALPALCRKNADFVEKVTLQSLLLMTEFGEDDEDGVDWAQTDDPDADEDDSNRVVGEEALDRIARKLGGKAVLPPIFQWLPQMISSQQWRERHAALMALSSIAEGCEKVMEPELEKVLDMILPLANDYHPRVRWAAANAIGQLSTDFAPTMQQVYHQRLLDKLSLLMQDKEPRVQTHAAAALVNFSEEADDATLEPYLDGILERLLRMLQVSKRYCQEQAVTTIATVADAAESKFMKYYDSIMPLLINVLRQGDGKEFRVLRGKAMECATLIAVAVGKDKFNPDAISLIHLLAGIQRKLSLAYMVTDIVESITDADDPQASYLISAWGRICTVLGMDFMPYLEGVMPPLLSAAKTKADFTVIEDESDRDKYLEEDGWEFMPVQGQEIGIRTSALEEKCIATEILILYASNLKAAFEPYVQPILKDIVIPGFKFYFHDGVRSAATKVAPQLVASIAAAYKNDRAKVDIIWQPLLHELLRHMETEPSVEMLANFYMCFYECVDIVGPNALTEEQLQKFVVAAQSQLSDYENRVQSRQELVRKGELDIEEDEEAAEDIEMDDVLLADLSKAFHAVFKSHGPVFLPIFEPLIRYVHDALQIPDHHHWGLCIICDIIEFCRERSANYHSIFVPALTKGITSDDPDVRQSAAYAIGVAAQFGGPAYQQFTAQCIPALFSVLMQPDARSEENIYASENASAALAKTCRFNGSKVGDLDNVINRWIGTLPLLNDTDEAPYAYIFLGELIAQEHPSIQTNFSHVVNSIVQALRKPSIVGQTAQHLQTAVKSLLSHNPAGAQSTLQSLQPQDQAFVQSWFSS